MGRDGTGPGRNARKRYGYSGGARPPGGGGGGYKGKGVKGGHSSSSVHDGIKILVVTIACAVAAVISGVAAFLIVGYA